MDTYERYQAAVKAIRSQGVKVRQNVRKCCRGCILPSDLGFPPEADGSSEEPGAYCYTYGGQGHAITWRDGVAYNAADLRRYERHFYSIPENARESRVYWNHGGGAGQVVADAFREQGFEVEWNGKEAFTVEVVLPA